MRPKIRSLTVKGFRSFGSAEQTLNVPGDLAVVWAPNSKGKTSLAEAIEFLLTGRISRRSLMSSTQEEFADALRNAHLDPAEDVFVAATLVGSDGSSHQLRRVLTHDYAKRQDCASSLDIDGQPASAADLTALGIHLSQPPLEAPVLAQHTLAYIFSVRPQDRSTYFKTLLEVTDLDKLRSDVEALSDRVSPPSEPLLDKFDAALAVPSLKPVLSSIAQALPQQDELAASVSSAAEALLQDLGEAIPSTLDERLHSVETALLERRSRTFPVGSFGNTKPHAPTAIPDATWKTLNTYLSERARIDEETRHLADLFQRALSIPSVSEASEPIDCPLCETPQGLVPTRIAALREHVEATRDFKTAEAAAQTSLDRLISLAIAIRSIATDVRPGFLRTTIEQRRASGFTLSRLQELLGNSAPDLLEPWLDQLRLLARATTAVRRKARAVHDHVKSQKDDPTTLDPQTIREAFSDLFSHTTDLVAANTAYQVPARQLLDAINGVIDLEADTTGWQDFVEAARDRNRLRGLLLGRAANANVATELDQALKDIDKAKEQVLEDKFADYSSAIQSWWERLRPNETTFFSAVRPRKKARRTIDIKAGLSAHADRSAPKVRDVIAVFSQSQLHCLGLAMFLARAQLEGLGFIVLDDPVQSSDEDYKVHFNATVISELLTLPIQTIICTQDHDTWEELETRYRHAGIAKAQLYIESPAEGTIIENTSDALLSKIVRAKSLARGGHPDVRKECGIQLRDAGERFCKEILVMDSRGKGDNTASLADHDGKTLEWLCPRVEPLLDQDPSHPGKLTVFKSTVNNACHDNTPPGTEEMVHACGEISRFVKDYLGR